MSKQKKKITRKRVVTKASPALVPLGPEADQLLETTIDPLMTGMLCQLAGDYIEMNTGFSPFMFDFFRIPGGLFTAPDDWRDCMEEVITVTSLNHYSCETTRRVAAVLAQMTAMSRILIDYTAYDTVNHKSLQALLRFAYGKQWLTETERTHLLRLAD